MKRKLWLSALVCLLFVGLFAASASAKTTLRLPKQLDAVMGFNISMDELLDDFNMYYGLPNDFKVKVSPASVASFEYDGDYFFDLVPNKVGTATIKLSSKSMNKTTSCKVYVRANAYSAKKPSYGKKKLLYTSPKKMYYNGSNIVVQMYIYNNTGMTVRSIEDLVIGLYDTDPDGQSWPRESVKVGKWIPSNGKLKNKAYDVITVTFNTRDDRELYVLNKKNYYYNRPEVAPGIDAGTPIVDGKATLLPAKKAGIAFEMEQ